MLLSTSPRKGVTVLEFAVVAPITFFLLLALIVGGMAIFRYQEVSHLAREGSRYASVHGGRYTLDRIPVTSGVPAVNSDSDIQAYVESRAAALDISKLKATISWSAPSTLSPINMPMYVDTDPNLVPPGQITIQNYVTVVVTYEWLPELYLIGPINLTSTSKVAMCY